MKILFTSALLFSSIALNAQKSFFQQKLNYNITVTLNDVNHTLIGVENLTYQNNSTDTLHEIYFHLYYNAFNGSSTAYTRQLNRVNDASFTFAKPEQLGGYNKFEAKIGAQLLEVTLQKDNPDIAKIVLNQPLLPNKSIALDINFEEKIPFAFSRPGHINQQYLITQWYPKPAVYDLTGWHALPYLENGEYYGEFATFDVKIILPENYIVAATGELQTQSERELIAQKANIPFLKTLQKNNSEDTFPVSSIKNKMIQFTAHDVHDFGWFADKRFMVVSEKIEKCAYTESNVICDVYFTPRDYALWKNGAHYARNAVEYYGTRIGKYPYSHASVVAQYDRRGSGMEYPMITVIGGAGTASDLESVVVHEVGHNWFYGILGSNERDFGWMDEGINTFYEMSYEDANAGIKNIKNVNLTDTQHPITYYADRVRGAHALYFNHQALAPSLSSDDFNNEQYGLAYYTRPALGLKSLEGYVGREKFDAVLQKYYSTWKFKHPQPNDFKNILSETLGDSVNWFLNDIIGSSQPTAYSIKSIKNEGANYNVVVQNKSGLAIPFSLSLVKNDSIIATKWYSGVACNDKECFYTVSFPNYKTGGTLILDAQNVLPQINFKRTALNLNQDGTPTGVSPFKISFITDNTLEPYKTKILFTPLPAYNFYDKFMLGLYVSNVTPIEKNWEWFGAPLYSFTTHSVRGAAQLNYTFFNEASRFIISGDVKSFATTTEDEPVFTGVTKNANYFSRYVASFRWDVNRNSANNTQHSFQFRQIHLNTTNTFISLNGNGNYLGLVNQNNTKIISELTYFGSNRRVTAESDWKIQAETIFDLGTKNTSDAVTNAGFFDRKNEPILRLNATYNYSNNYNTHAKYYIRAFAATAIGNKGFYFYNERTVSLFQRGFNDYKFDSYFLGRNETFGKLSQQIDDNAQGGMKIILPRGQVNNLGVSSQFAASVNTKIDVPFKLPADFKIQPYLDFGYFANDNNYSNLEPINFLVSGGISFSIPKYFAVYVPLYFNGGSNPNGLSSLMASSSFLNTIAFSININSLLPKNFQH